MRKLDTIVGEDLESASLDDLITIEAPTVEEAMARLAAEVGEDARIVSAEKEARGGLGGFFAKEMVVLTARRPEQDQSGLPGVLERLTRDADLKEQAFGDVLRRELADHRPSSGLGNFLNAAGWSPSAAPAAGAALPEPTLLEPAAGGSVVGDIATASSFGGGGGTETAEIEPAPHPVGPMAAVQRPPAPTSPMGNATVAERIANEHLVMMPERHLGPSPVVTMAAGWPSASIDVTAAGLADDPLPAVQVSATTPDAVDRDDPAATMSADGPVAAGAPAGRGTPSWSVTELVRHGLPESLVRAVAGLATTDDLAWINALAAAIAPWCGPLPEGDRVVVGTGADRLSEALDLPQVRLGDVAPYGGSFCSVLTGAPDDRAWLDFVRGGRHLHFVLGEDELWRDLLVADPEVVSWVSPSGLIDALYLASTLGATLGFGSLSPDEPMLRAQPVDVALALRQIVGRS